MGASRRLRLAQTPRAGEDLKALVRAASLLRAVPHSRKRVEGQRNAERRAQSNQALS